MKSIKKILILATRSRAARIVNYIGEDKASFVIIDPTGIDLFKVLSEHDHKLYDIAIIDDASMADEMMMRNDIPRFMNTGRCASAKLRIMFLASPERMKDTELLSVLVATAVFDIIEDDRDDTAERIRHCIDKPMMLHQVAQFRRGAIYTEPRISPEPKGEAITPAKAARNSRSDRNVIGVVGVGPREGTTMAALAIARSIVLSGRDKVALLVDEETYCDLKSGWAFNAYVNADGDYNLQGISFYNSCKVDDIPLGYDAIVIDYGRIYIKSDADIPLEKEIEIRNSDKVAREDEALKRAITAYDDLHGKCNIRVVVGTCSLINDPIKWQRLMNDQTDTHIRSWNIVLNRPTYHGEQYLRRQVEAHWPDANVTVMDHMDLEPVMSYDVYPFVRDIWKHEGLGELDVASKHLVGRTSANERAFDEQLSRVEAKRQERAAKMFRNEIWKIVKEDEKKLRKYGDPLGKGGKA